MSDAASGLRDLWHAGEELPFGPAGRDALGWWGMLGVVVTEAALFGYLLFSYFYYAAQLGTQFQPDSPPTMRLALPGVILLLLSGASFWWAERAARNGNGNRLRAGVAATAALGVLFLILQVLDWRGETFSLRSSAYGSLFFVTTGLHFAHLAAGVGALVLLIAWSMLGYFDPTRMAAIRIVGLYWYFVIAIGVAVFLTFYVSPALWVS